MKLFIYFVGKPRDAHANAIAAEYLKRCGRWTTCEMREVVAGRFDPFEKHRSAFKVALDPAGKPHSSEAFMDLLRRLEDQGRDGAFLIGGHDGLPPEWKERADLSISLSAMTFSHEMARAMLAEQIYRAFATLRGHPYAR